MIHRIPTPRILPLTIAVMAALLAVKSVGLVRAAAMSAENSSTLMVASAQASEKPAEKKPAEKPAAAHGSPSPKPAAEEAAAPPIPTEPPISDSERAVLLELRQRGQELDARETTLSARESMLAAAEQKLSARVSELMTLQKRLEALDAGREQREEASWQGLVKVYETMKARDAATIFNDLAPNVLLNVLDRMKDSKAAPVLAAMNPDKARDITAQLAQLRTQRNAPLDATASRPVAPTASPMPPTVPPKGSRTPG